LFEGLAMKIHKVKKGPYLICSWALGWSQYTVFIGVAGGWRSRMESSRFTHVDVWLWPWATSLTLGRLNAGLHREISAPGQLNPRVQES
jgi:hypothetical protein